MMTNWNFIACRGMFLLVQHIILYEMVEKKKLGNKHDEFSKNLVAFKWSTNFMHSP